MDVKVLGHCLVKKVLLHTLVSDGHAGGQEGQEEGEEEGEEDHWEQVDVWFGIKDLVHVH